MKVDKLLEIIGSDFYTGVPDSQLKVLCDQLMSLYGIDPEHHIIAANEGNAAALAAGYHLATGKVPVVYMQNSGEGNIVNPSASLLNRAVYSIPVVFIIGWRGEPGIHDEPQHIWQGEITLKLLEDLETEYFVIGKDTSDKEVSSAMDRFKVLLEQGRNVAFVIRKGALTDAPKVLYGNGNKMVREDIINHILKYSGESPVISTTGKASREIFEARASAGQSHKYDFLTVGSMGHASSIALGIAINKPGQKIFCVDGDGAVLMHMGALALIGTNKPKNLIHIVINNASHETVGGMPTVASEINLVNIAKACGYPYAVCAGSFDELDKELESAVARDELSFIEVPASIGSRPDLGRPTTTALENKINFMEYLDTL